MPEPSVPHKLEDVCDHREMTQHDIFEWYQEDEATRPRLLLNWIDAYSDTSLFLGSRFKFTANAITATREKGDVRSLANLMQSWIFEVTGLKDWSYGLTMEIVPCWDAFTQSATDKMGLSQEYKDSFKGLPTSLIRVKNLTLVPRSPNIEDDAQVIKGADLPSSGPNIEIIL